MAPKRSNKRPRQTKLNFSPASTSKSKHVALHDSSSDEAPARPSKRQRLEADPRRSGRHQRQNMFDSSDVDVATSAASSEDELQARVTVVRRGRSNKHSVPPPVSTGSGEEEEVQPRKKRRRITRRVRKKTDSDETGEEECGATVEVLPRTKQHGQTRRASMSETNDNDDGEEEQQDQPSENEDLEEDLAFLNSSPIQDKDRLRGPKPMNNRQKALEALKQRRRGGTGEPSSSATPGRGRPVIADSDSDLEIIKEESEEENQQAFDQEQEVSDGDDQETNARDMFQENNSDDNFIDDDDAAANEGPIGAPSSASQIPIEFTGLSLAKPRELFKYAIEWMVHKKINPAFNSNDDIYRLTFRKLDDEVNGLATSKFSSSAWTADFSRTIRARPEMVINEIPKAFRAANAHCEACNRSNHIAIWAVNFNGLPYSKMSLEPLAGDSDSSSSDNNDEESDISADEDASEAQLNGEKPAYDAHGERLPPESKTFTLGSTCKANAQVAHTLHHWCYHLNDWVVDYLTREGYCTAEELIKRDKMSDRKRAKKANKIVDRMEAEGEVKKLHRLYKDQVDFALEAQNDYTKGWGRKKM